MLNWLVDLIVPIAERWYSLIYEDSVRNDHDKLATRKIECCDTVLTVWMSMFAEQAMGIIKWYNSRTLGF
jgi:hypothetical protein